MVNRYLVYSPVRWSEIGIFIARVQGIASYFFFLNNFFPSLEKISRKIFRGLSANIEGRNVCTLYGSSIIARFLFFWNFCTRQNCTRDGNTFPFTVQPSGDFWILYCQTLWNSLNCPRQWHGYARNPRNTEKRKLHDKCSIFFFKHEPSRDF